MTSPPAGLCESCFSYVGAPSTCYAEFLLCSRDLTNTIDPSPISLIKETTPTQRGHIAHGQFGFTSIPSSQQTRRGQDNILLSEAHLGIQRQVQSEHIAGTMRICTEQINDLLIFATTQRKRWHFYLSSLLTRMLSLREDKSLAPNHTANKLPKARFEPKGHEAPKLHSFHPSVMLPRFSQCWANERQLCEIS